LWRSGLLKNTLLDDRSRLLRRIRSQLAPYHHSVRPI
jgi:hypothetical protein